MNGRNGESRIGDSINGTGERARDRHALRGRELPKEAKAVPGYLTQQLPEEAARHSSIVAIPFGLEQRPALSAAPHCLQFLPVVKALRAPYTPWFPPCDHPEPLSALLPAPWSRQLFPSMSSPRLRVLSLAINRPNGPTIIDLRLTPECFPRIYEEEENIYAAVDARSESLQNLRELGPPDLVYLVKQPKTNAHHQVGRRKCGRRHTLRMRSDNG